MSILLGCILVVASMGWVIMLTSFACLISMRFTKRGIETDQTLN